jgi:hypothetical protein
MVQAPIEMSAHMGGAWAWTYLSIAGVIASFVLMTLRTIRTRQILWLVLIPASAICFFLEPFGDVIGLTWYPADSPWIIGTWMGRPMPAYLLFTYTAYFSLGFYGCYSYLVKSPSVAAIARLWVITTLVNCSLEMTFLQMGVYVYYGNNPSKILGLPLYSMIQNGGAVILGGLLLMWAERTLRGWRSLWLIPAVPGMFVAYAVAGTWPVYVALNSAAEGIWIWLPIAWAVVVCIAIPIAVMRSREFGIPAFQPEAQ